MEGKFDGIIIQKYVNAITHDKYHRYKSWDNCFKVFSQDKPGENHALHLAFYLASWGMYRGSGGLLQKNHLIHEGAVEIIYKNIYEDLKCSKNHEVSKKEIPLIMQLKKELSDYYKKIPFVRGIKDSKISDTDTLISKLILGTTACVPAYDRYFILGLKDKAMRYSKFSEASLNELFVFKDAHTNEIRKYQEILSETEIHYPVMKILDMYFWQIGYDKEMNVKAQNKLAS